MGYQERVRAERAELSSKVDKLVSFMGDGAGGVSAEFLKLPADEQFRLRLQIQAMCMYLDILDERIEHFE
jgi:hypothetical protein